MLREPYVGAGGCLQILLFVPASYCFTLITFLHPHTPPSLLQGADMVLWLGISFKQSASVEYFRRVRSLLQANASHSNSGGGASGDAQAAASGSRGRVIHQAIVNPSDEPYFNLVSSCCNTDDLQVWGGMWGVGEARGGGRLLLITHCTPHTQLMYVCVT